MMNLTTRSQTVGLLADRDVLMSHAGAALSELTDGMGLTAALSDLRERPSAHDPSECCATWR